MISQQQNRLVLIARDQFFSSYQMLETLLDVCPDEVWYGVYGGVPFWYQVYHTIYFVDYWFREDYCAANFLCMRFDERIPPEFEWDVPDSISVSRREMREYLRLIREKLMRVFAAMRDDQLAAPVFPSGDTITLLDIVFAQSRHVMYNIGYCNGVLRARGFPESDWYAYNEANE